MLSTSSLKKKIPRSPMSYTILKNILVAMLICLAPQLYAKGNIENGTDWKDTDGNPISCHEGAMSRFGDTFYWYGTSYVGNPGGAYGKNQQSKGLQQGLNVYSSRDLVHWKYEGVCLDYKASGNTIRGSGHRPNVIYNDLTKKYVMWFFDIADKYPDVMMTVAVSDSPIGPFNILGLQRTGEKNGYAQDCALFKDDDGKAYLAYDDGHRNLRVDLLSDDYLSSTKKGVMALKAPGEGTAMSKFKGKYIVAGSGVRGWGATETAIAVAESPLGKYSSRQLASESRTWGSQISSFIYIKESNTLMALCDQWWAGQNGRKDLDASRYLWIPVSLNPATGEARLEYKAQWNPLKSK